MNPAHPKLTVRVGCHLVYETAIPTPIILVLKPRRDDRQQVLQERFTVTPGPVFREFNDVHGNITQRAMLQPGQTVVHHDALVSVTSESDNLRPHGHAVPVEQLPEDILRYTLPSRYCDTDKLLDFAWRQFGPLHEGVQHVRAICDWTHYQIAYRFGGGRSDISASDVINQRFGVCRDFAHVAIALCRAFNLPARYVTGHLPDIGNIDPGTPMDFHAYFEVYLGNAWHTFDARFNVPRIGRIKVAQGLDAVDGAFSTIYGAAQSVWFEVWSYQIDPRQVSLDDPIDLSKRLDGTKQIRLRS
jgi:transglutaminase-like putative cysteine protease